MAKQTARVLVDEAAHCALRECRPMVARELSFSREIGTQCLFEHPSSSLLATNSFLNSSASRMLTKGDLFVLSEWTRLSNP